ncbi:MAG TPA: monovalent cation/H(+) antiporter subunit G [Bdellovibrionota bacterium]|jgi:multicomponent Na+:H+ antiporter subunit G|nr:monovalent cation/H(+) antiporter subunit G [Bdellovibrionota bacterium]
MTALTFGINACLVLGTFFCAVATIGILRMPDVFLRIHTATKASTLGLMLLALSGVLKFWGSPEFAAVAAKSALIVIFLLLTTPVAAHLIGRAARARANPTSAKMSLDEYDLKD